MQAPYAISRLNSFNVLQKRSEKLTRRHLQVPEELIGLGRPLQALLDKILPTLRCPLIRPDAHDFLCLFTFNLIHLLFKLRMLRDKQFHTRLSYPPIRSTTVHSGIWQNKLMRLKNDFLDLHKCGILLYFLILSKSYLNVLKCYLYCIQCNCFHVVKVFAIGIF